MSTSSDDRFSLVELRRIYKQLVENKQITSNNQDLVVEILRVIAEMVVYGDNKSELLFDFFCEKSMLSLFLEIMYCETICPNLVHIQILQTLSILISCVKNDTSLYYLLSNNHINDILMFPHDFSADESLCAQYASFMKTLSLRLNDQTVQFFFREETGAFPLLIKAVELLANKDPMIKISAQTTILNIFRVNESKSMEYALQDEVLMVLLECMVNIMRNQLENLISNSCEYIKEYLSGKSTVKTIQTFEDILIGIEDWIYYLQDVVNLNIEVLHKSLVSYFLDSFVFTIVQEKLVRFATKVQSGEIDSISSIWIEYKININI
jgi:protein CLEC16A